MDSHEISAPVFGSQKYYFLRKFFLFISPKANVPTSARSNVSIKVVKITWQTVRCYSTRTKWIQRESVPDFEPLLQQKVVDEESFPEGTSEKTVDTTTTSLGKRPRSSDTSPLSDIALKKPREKSSTVIGQPVFEMASDLAKAP